MKTLLSKTQAQEKITNFFSKPDFTPKELKKILRLAMKYRISLKEQRKLFCKKCKSQLKGKTRITRSQKTITCYICAHKNRHKI